MSTFFYFSFLHLFILYDIIYSNIGDIFGILSKTPSFLNFSLIDAADIPPFSAYLPYYFTKKGTKKWTSFPLYQNYCVNSLEVR